tara:strand:+ start:898 stop:1134 length:237 start_codon:yes stop_codon:yes gene_type:complete
MTDKELKVGARLIATVEIDRFPDAVIPKGDVLVVTEADGDTVWAFDATRTVKGLEDWDNCVQFDSLRPWSSEVKEESE